MDIEWIEGATHYNSSYGGFFFNEKEFTTNKGRSWTMMGPLTFAYWAARDTTILRGGVALPAAVEEPKPKQPIGWWS